MSELVSVLMCVYNTPIVYLQESIESILKQTYQNFEFVIDDDGSDDLDTLNCLESYSVEDNRIKVIHNVNNIGLTKSLNVGLKKCHGAYIARMDADDISFPNRLEKQIDYLRMNADVCLVGSAVCVFDSDINNGVYSPYPIEYKLRDRYEMAMLFDHFGPAHPTFLFRKDFLIDKGITYDECIAKAQDYAIKVDILKNGGHIAIMDEALLGYRVHEGQISNTSKSKQDECHQVISLRYLKFVFNGLSDKDANILSTLRIRKIYYPGIVRYVFSCLKICRLNKVEKIYDSDMFNSLIRELAFQKIKEMIFLHHSL